VRLAYRPEPDLHKDEISSSKASGLVKLIGRYHGECSR
jgi:hypothetical protein